MDEQKSCIPIPCPSFQDETLNVVATSEVDQLAVRAYAAYGRFTDNKNFLGNEMPRYEDLPEKIRGAWHAAVRQVMDDM